MRFRDLAQKPAPELDQLANTWKTKIQELRFQASTRQLKDVSQLGKLKRDLARLETLRSKNVLAPVFT